jgi:D-serine deaminase-like pyridoxal phosphate-dependent protein
MFGHNSLAALGQNDRAASALIPNAQMNIARYEEIISRMKKNLEREKQSIRHVKT